jgi:membrane-bound lytic murein transglycosylase D
VPRLIALSTIVAFDEALGVDLPPVPNQPAFVAVDTGGQIEMLRAAELAGLELMDLRRYNPGVLRWATAPGANGCWYPRPRRRPARTGLAALPADQRVTWQHYRIRRGDSLIRIARRFDTEVALLREVNNLRGNLIRAGDTLMIPDSAAWQDSLALAGGGASTRSGYTVRAAIRCTRSPALSTCRSMNWSLEQARPAPLPAAGAVPDPVPGPALSRGRRRRQGRMRNSSA